MALHGSLDDVPLVDVLQFIHLSGKSGVVAISAPQGPAWIEFSRGNIVFAHGPSTRSLGMLLVQAGLVSEDAVARAAQMQRTNAVREPLGKLLVEREKVAPEALAKALRQQIHETITELAGWTRGEFEFDAGPVVAVPDAVRVGVDELLPHLNINTQYLLLEAARLFDERRRARGESATAPLPQTDELPPPPAASSARTPGVASAPPMLLDGAAAPAEPLAPAESTKAAHATRTSEGTGARRTGVRTAPAGATRAVLVGGGDDIDALVVRAATRAGLSHERSTLQGVESLLDAREKAGVHVVVVWHLEAIARATLLDRARLIRRLRAEHPRAQHIVLTESPAPQIASMLYAAGVRSVVPVLRDAARTPSPVSPALAVLFSQQRRDAAMAVSVQSAELRAWRRAKRVTIEMQQALERANVALELLRIAASTLDRAALFLLKKNELIGLGAFGLTTAGRSMAEALRGLAVEVVDGTPLAHAITSGATSSGPLEKLGLGPLFQRLAGKPAFNCGVLVPLASSSRTIGVLYADNGGVRAAPEGVHAVEIAAAQAGIAYENALLRLKLGQPKDEDAIEDAAEGAA